MGEVVVLLVLLTVVLGGVGLYRRHAVNQRQAEEQAALETQLSTSKRAADEDVTKFGEELQRLDSDVAGHALDEPMQQDYQRALDAYDDAKMSLDAVTKPDEIGTSPRSWRTVDTPWPASRPGSPSNRCRPSDRLVSSTRPRPVVARRRLGPPGGVARSVPACPADAERVLAGADPYIRTVQVGAQRVPYWEGGQAYAPWAQGYYSRWSGSDMLSGMLIGGMLFGGMGNMFGGIGDGLGGIGEGDRRHRQRDRRRHRRHRERDRRHVRRHVRLTGQDERATLKPAPSGRLRVAPRSPSSPRPS